MTHPPRQIGICGTFDVENYGDLLFPLIAETELQRRLGPIRLHRFSYWQKAQPDWPYKVNSVTELPAAAAQLDGMIIGGGDLLRFDELVAPGYRPPVPEVHHPTGYWLTPMLIALQYGCPVVWNAPGAVGPIPSWAEPLLELAIALSSYVAVRDEASRQALERFAKNRAINVVPDTGFGISWLVNLERPSVEYLRLSESSRLKTPYIVVQPTFGLEAFSRLAQNHPQMLMDYQLVVLPIGPALGDDCANLNLPGSICITPWPGPLVLAELIGHSAAVVGVSLHLAITALAFGVPVFRPAVNLYSKHAILSQFDAVARFDAKAEIDPDWFIAKLGQASASRQLLQVIGRLERHWDEIADVLSAGCEKPDTLENLGRFWQSTPTMLQGWATRLAIAREERQAALVEQMTVNAQRDAAIVERNAAVAERGTAVAERNAAAAERDAAIGERNAAAAERDTAVAERNAAAADRDTAIGESNAAAAERDAAMIERNAVYSSISWRITAPLRAVRRTLRGNKEQIRQRLGGILRRR